MFDKYNLYAIIIQEITNDLLGGSGFNPSWPAGTARLLKFVKMSRTSPGVAKRRLVCSDDVVVELASRRSRLWGSGPVGHSLNQPTKTATAPLQGCRFSL